MCAARVRHASERARGAARTVVPPRRQCKHMLAVRLAPSLKPSGIDRRVISDADYHSSMSNIQGGLAGRL